LELEAPERRPCASARTLREPEPPIGAISGWREQYGAERGEGIGETGENR